MTEKNNIVLIGFMGAGKTTLGRWISENANMQYIDTDDYIENLEGAAISEIFAAKGEEYFRDLETAALKKMCENLEGAVVSAGGGMPVREENRRLMRSLGTVVYLRASEDELAKRLEGDVKRPMLAGADLKQRIHELMQKREQMYLAASDIIVDTFGKSMSRMYNEIEDYVVNDR